MKALRHRGQVFVGISAPIGMLILTICMLLTMREDVWRAADRASENLLAVIAQDVSRNIALYGLSLQGVVDNLHTPGLDGMNPALRQLILFDRAADASDKGIMLILDEKGDIVEQMGTLTPPRGNNADRAYFQVHRARPDVGLFISKPMICRLAGDPVIALSRRISKPDGSFGGVVVGTMKLSYFTALFQRVGLGPESAVNLFLGDGTRIARFPYTEADIGASIGNSDIFRRFLADGHGAFDADSVRDGVSRRYTYKRIGELPLILDVAESRDDVERAWRAKALLVMTASLLLCGSAILLVLWAAREFRHRIAIEGELAHLSTTDALTGVLNRRSFDDALAMVRTEAGPVSLVIIDADHFKRVNDRLGHQAGDEALRILARCLLASVRTPADRVCRLGGEEFALLLPQTTLREALRAAERVHDEVVRRSAQPVPGGTFQLTVSIGVACTTESSVADPTSLYAAADAALFRAKHEGRARTCWGEDGRTRPNQVVELRRVACG